MAKRFIAGNWKMNGGLADLDEAAKVNAALKEMGAGMNSAICPPAALVYPMIERLKGGVLSVGGQDCHAAESGAHTGDSSAALFAELGAKYVIVGHSERRTDHGEKDAVVKAKAQAVYRQNLVPIVCIGETLEEREAGKTLEVLTTQLEGSIPTEVPGEDLVVAYEPVWAIGTGKTPTLDDIAQAHAHIRAELGRIGVKNFGETPLQYGGSVKPGNAKEILAIKDVDGALVGGASLKASDFIAILQAGL